MNNEYEQPFINRLGSLERGDLAILKRNAGLRLEESRGALPIFYRIYFPVKDSGFDFNERACFLISTLYGHNKYSSANTNFGHTMRKIKEMKNSANIDNRMSILLDSTFDSFTGEGDFPHRLTQLVKIANSSGIGIDWVELLSDCKNWSRPSKYVQKKWAKSYFADYSERSDSKSSKES